MRGDASAFDLAGDDRGVLLLHGFTGTPFEVRFLGERLHARGPTCVGLRLPGHASTPEELDRSRAAAWAEEVERGLNRLRARCRRVAVVGQSLGGLLALDLATRRSDDLAAVATLGAPLWLHADARALVAALRLLPAAARTRLRPLAKVGGSDVGDRAMWAANPSYAVIPLAALVAFDGFRRAVRGRLAEVRAPLLVVHAIHDHVAPFASADEIVRRVRSTVVRRLTLPRSYHLVSIDVERERVAAEVGDLVVAHLGGAMG